VLILALDSATPVLSLALFDTEGGRVLAERAEEPPQSHSVALPGAIIGLLSEIGATLADLRGIAVGIGPGSFTGLRVGLATAKGLCYAKGIPLVGVSSLKAMAGSATSRTSPGTLLVPCLYARKSEVYAGFYRAGGLEPVFEEAALTPEALALRVSGLGERPILFGNGRDRNAPVFASLPPAPAGVPATPGAVAIARLAGPWSPFDRARLFALEPHYIRRSEAEVKFPDGLRGPGIAARRIQSSRRKPGRRS
jgi:tRNA threonylcarbamoyladenosine biosynthesis protein TsaB